ncbi:DUF3824 domain-containing protein [Plantactinospora sp. WMMB334]|uniref:DUF3824 domain-containing protein n=1 Tax=Plantactinospora sp. WMMB334 TaxID=3404119 RepID=UPI003B923534
MRHLGSLVLGLVSAPIIWVLTGIGWIRFNGGIQADELGDKLLGFVVLLVVGGLLAALLLPRWSPVGPAVAGCLFMIMALWSLVDFGSLVDVVPDSLFGVRFALTAPSGALSVLLGVLLFATVAVPHRWRSTRPALAGFPGAPGQPGYPPYPGAPVPHSRQFPHSPQFPPGGPVPGQFPPGGPVPGQFPPGMPGPAGHPPNYGPSAAPSFPQSAPPNFGPAVPPNYGPTAPAPPPPPAPPYDAPAGATHHGPPPIPAPRPAEPSSADETTRITGPDDDMDGVTRRLGDR